MRGWKTTTAIALVMGLSASLRGQSIPATEPPVVPLGPQTQLDVTPSGTPIINIAKPDDKGTSYNLYTKFNVGREGVILNNSKVIGNTLIGGQILANPNLRQGNNANLILNEVIGGTRSDLYGPIEIFGPKAAFILANQAGITCGGCGFINISRVSLSTGKIVLDGNGAFTGFAVDGGDVLVKGEGLLAGNVDYFDIVTGSAQINASLYARDLVVAGGSSDFDYTARNTQARAGGSNLLAIDSSLLGGMYANRIRLIGTGAGVGVNLLGTVTSLEGPLEITADGQIAVRNAVGASDITLKSGGGNIRIDERLYAGGTARFDAAGNITQSVGFVGAAKDVSLKAGGNITLAGQGVYAGLSAEGKLDQQGAIAVTAQGAVDVANAQLIATKDFSVTADRIGLGANSSLAANGSSLTARGAVSAEGQIESQADIKLNADVINLSGSTIANGQLSLDGRQIVIDGGAVGLGGATAKSQQSLAIGKSGSLQTNGALGVLAADVDNKGKLLGVTGASVTTAATLNNSGIILSGAALDVTSGGDSNISGSLSANGIATIRSAGQLDVSGSIASAGNLTVDSNALKLSGQLSTSGDLSVRSRTIIDAAEKSIIVSDGNAVLNAEQDIAAKGYVSAGKTLGLQAKGALDIAGQVHAKDVLTAEATTIKVGGIVVSDANLTLRSAGAAYINGDLSAQGVLNIDAKSITTASGSKSVANGNIGFTSATSINNAGAVSGRNVALNANIAVSNTGSLFAANTLNLRAIDRIDQAGVVEASGSVAMTADALNISGRSLGIGGVALLGRDVTLSALSDLQSGAAFDISATGKLTLAGNILSVGIADLRSAADLDQLARISFGSNATIAAGGRLRQNGLITATGTLDMSGFGVLGSGDIASNGAISIRSLSGNIDLTSNISSASSLSLTAPNRVLLSGVVQTDGLLSIAATDALISGSVTALRGLNSAITNSVAIASQGSLRSGTALSLDLAQLDNAGLLYAAGQLSLTTSGSLGNNGQIISDDLIRLNIGRSLSNAGLVQAGKDLLATITGAATFGGTISSGGALDLRSNSLNIRGVVASEGALSLASNAINIASSGVVFSRDALTVLASDSLTSAGRIVGNGASVLAATNSLINSGIIESDQSLALTANDISLGGQVTALSSLTASAVNKIDITGQLSANGALAINANDILLRSGGVAVGGSEVNISARNLARLDGQMAASGALSVRADQLQNNGSLFGDGVVNLSGVGTLNQTGLVQAAGKLTLDGGALALSGQTIGLGGIKAVGDTLLLDGSLAATNLIDISARAATINGSIASQQGITARINRAIAVTARAVLQTDGNTSIDAGSASLSGRLLTNGNVSIVTDADLAASGVVLSGGAISLTSGANLSVSGGVTANGITKLRASKIADISGAIGSVGALDITASAINLTGSASSSNIIGLTADNVNAAIGSQILADGAVRISAAQSFLAAGTLSSRAAVDLIAGAKLTASGSTTAHGAITVRANESAISGAMLSDAAINLTSTGASSVDGSVLAGGAIAVTADNLNTGVSSRIASNANIGLSASNAALLQGAVNGDGIRISAGTSLTNSGTLFAASLLTATADSIVHSGSSIGLTGLQLNARAIASGTASNTQTGGSLNINASEALDLAGSLLSVGNALIAAGTRFDQRAALSFGADARLQAGGALRQMGAVEATGNVVLSGNSITGLGRIRVDKNLNFEAGAGGIDYAGTLTALSGLSLATPGNIRLTGDTSTNGIFGLNAANIDIDAIVTGIAGITPVSNGNLNIGTAGALRSGSNLSLNLGSLNNAGLLSAANGLNIITQLQLANTGIIAAGEALAFNTGTSLTNAGTLQAGSSLSATVNGSASLSGNVYATGPLTVSAQDIVASGIFVTDASVALNALQDITFTSGAFVYSVGNQSLVSGRDFSNMGSISTDASLTIRSARSFDSSGRIQSGLAQTLSGGAVNLSDAVLSLGSLDISAIGNLAIAADIAAKGALNLSGNAIRLNSNAKLITDNIATANAATQFDNLGLIGANGAIGVTASSFSNAGNIIGDNSITLNVTSNAVQSGLVQAGTNLVLNAGAMTLSGNTLGIGTVRVTGSTLDLKNGSALRSGGTLDVTTSGTATVNGQLSSAAATQVLAGSNLTVGGSLTSGESIKLDAVNALSIGGVVEGSGKIELLGGEVAFNGKLTTNDQLMVKARTGDLSFGGVAISEGNAGFQAANTLNLLGQ
jgi:filamentous hemagglutinin